MRYLYILFLGICIGILGELLIPENLSPTIGTICIKRASDGLVFIPQLLIYDKKINDDIVRVGGDAVAFVPSYRYTYGLLTGEIKYLNKDECNVLLLKYYSHEHK